MPQLLTGPQTGFYSQGDWDPSSTGGGTVWFEESPTMITVTWDAVRSWSTTGTNTFQMQFDPTGIVTMVWVSMTPLGGNGGVMVGYSPAGPSSDPGNTDLSAIGAGAITLGTTDVLPLALSGVSRPIMGTSWTLGAASIPATGLFGVSIYGIADPGILDLSFLGMPSCQLRSTLDLLDGPWLVTGTTQNRALPIPNTPTVLNFNLFTQAAVWTVPPPNQFGAIISNGVRGTIGDV